MWTPAGEHSLLCLLDNRVQSLNRGQRTVALPRLGRYHSLLWRWAEA
ncbi:hypothetical protein [Pseudomonas anguilliseptica]|nr:hypothetical protein [Pseudomonas anguilliseptica]